MGHEENAGKMLTLPQFLPLHLMFPTLFHPLHISKVLLLYTCTCQVAKLFC